MCVWGGGSGQPKKTPKYATDDDDDDDDGDDDDDDDEYGKKETETETRKPLVTLSGIGWTYYISEPTQR